jgi:hypothetical protein
MGAEVRAVRVAAGLRVGFWDQNGTQWNGGPFKPKGYYNGPELGDHIPGTLLEQQLMEGTLRFRVGVLFRPDLNVKQRLETILILENWIPEMFEYQDWEQELAIGE